MRRWFALYRANLAVHLAIQFQYRWAMAIWFLWNIIGPVVYVTVWSTVAHNQGGTVGGLDQGALAGYFVVMMVANHFTDSWIHWEFEHRVREGSLSQLLLKPVHPIHYDIMENLAFRVVTFTMLVPAVGVFALVFHPAIPAPWWAWVAVWPVLALTFVLRFLMSWMVGLTSFWTTRIEATGGIYEWIAMFLSGRIAPLELLPAWLRTLSHFTPFAVTLPLPVNLMMGHLSPEQLLRGMALQAAWMVIAVGMLTVVWRRGVRRYSAVGA